MEEVTPHEARRRTAEGALLLDVREPGEYQEARVAGSLLLPLGDLPAKLAELDPGRETVIICRSGARSGRATEFMTAQGFRQVSNLAGGILAWEAEGLPVERGDS